jgi:hypothetical protein
VLASPYLQRGHLLRLELCHGARSSGDRPMPNDDDLTTGVPGLFCVHGI